MIIVHNGEMVLSIPATELSMCCCAVVKRKAGIKTPINPDKNNLEVCVDRVSFHFKMARGSKMIPATVTRREATSPGEKTTRPFFISMNDVPQISASISRSMIESGEFLFSKAKDSEGTLNSEY